MNTEAIKERLKREVKGIKLEEKAPMKRYTSFRAGGEAELMAMPDGVHDLKRLLVILEEEKCPFFILGNGSNVLVRDGGYRGVIVKIGESFASIEGREDRLVCGCGALLSAAAREAAERGLSGLEFASGIPGSVGGAVFMNAGAYDGEMAHVLEKVRLVSRDGSRDFYVTGKELQMGYRHTLLHETGDIAVEAVMKLKAGDRETIKLKMADFTERRNKKQPVAYPSAGSFFKRPEGYFAGKLIQDAGLKGLSVGGARVSELHSGFIINTGNATAGDILRLMEIVQAAVMDRFNVRLEPEVRIIGE
ncbi:MAG TPA: UDP-N-acetylmuramate dehydrogenase [Candidatus Copromorpha excrementigallinarum]|uniref:UDP-N-acetylenolpyruvoylglucosamine reductase n=1 Tax=Candidatus Allocopromorpha excrementigallinarum TaxID=2840742 RepID=A0A9D1I1N3_9FIRM|nr:UDP-N-acetylmuramate dehydrogenase [Candidatus Copromorpha excrementigallinarum]